jgi:hypothetical protein
MQHWLAALVHNTQAQAEAVVEIAQQDTQAVQEL